MATMLMRALAIAGACGLACLSILLFPQPLYANHVRFGRLTLYCDQPFGAEKARQVLREVEHRLSLAPAALQDDSDYNIFVSRAKWRKHLTFLWNRGGGVNYYPIAANIFIGSADIDTDRVFHSDGTSVEPPRTLAYFAAHEIGHSLIGKRVGALANWRLPAWTREGLADYVAFSSDVDVEALTQQLRAGDPALDPKRSGLYARYRLLVAYYLSNGWSVDELLASRLRLVDAEWPLLDKTRPPREL